eukprot:2272528-Rhodomonas_salina.2
MVDPAACSSSVRVFTCVHTPARIPLPPPTAEKNAKIQDTCLSMLRSCGRRAQNLRDQSDVKG